MGGEAELGRRLARTCPHCGGREPTLGNLCPLCGRPYETPPPGLLDWLPEPDFGYGSRGALAEFVVVPVALPFALVAGVIRWVVRSARRRV